MVIAVGSLKTLHGEVAGLTNLLIIVTTYLSKFIRDDKVFKIFIKTLSNAS